MSRLVTLWSLAALVAAAFACAPPSILAGREVPAPRTDAMTAFDPVSGTIVMFGGQNRAGTLNETWTWDGAGWRLEHPAHSPSARERGLMAFDPATKKVILFGGQTCAPPAPDGTIGCEYATDTRSLHDTWAWDGNAWAQLKTAHVPQVPHFAEDMAAAAADPASGQLIMLFWVAQPSAATFPETWTLTGGDWKQLHPAHSPYDELFGGVAFDASSNRLMLLQPGAGHYDCGGAQCFQPPTFDMTWTWDGSEWRNLGPAPNTPHDYGALVEDGSAGVMYVDDGGGFTIWNGSRWESRALVPWADVPLSGWTGAFDSASRQLVIYGGRVWGRNHLFGDTYSWNGKAWKTVVRAPPSPSARLSACSAAQAEAGYGAGISPTDPNATGFEVGFAEPRSGPCHIDSVVHFKLVAPDGGPVPIPGNPAQIRINTDLTFESGHVYAVFTVVNGCALSGGVGLFTGDGLDQTYGGVAGSCTGSPGPASLMASTRTNLREH